MVILVDDYVSARRRLGFDLQKPARLLQDFARYCDAHQIRAITTDLAIRWARATNASARHVEIRLSAVRSFAKYRAAFDTETEIPPTGITQRSHGRRPPPYIYQEAEIHALMQAARKLGPVGTLKPSTYFTLFGLLWATGLRVSEALNLSRRNADLSSGVLRIERTKFKKSRLVPIHPSTQRALKQYAAQRDRHHPFARMFFVTDRGTQLRPSSVRGTFADLRATIGLHGRGGRLPRIHDFRHTFAVQRILEWYRHGENIDARIGALSTYLGHVHAECTYWYLEAVPELLSIAANRYERFAKIERHSS